MYNKTVYFMISLQNNASIVGLSTIHNAYLRMKPQVKNVENISQGSSDPEASWAKARFAFMKQLAIRFGKLDPTKESDPLDPALQPNEPSNGKLIVVLGGCCFTWRLNFLATRKVTFALIATSTPPPLKRSLKSNTKTKSDFILVWHQ